jgi:hypothetical protein
MTSFYLFTHFFKESYQTFVRDFSKYLGSYIAFVAISFLASIPWAGIGFESNGTYEIMMGILVAILSLVVIVNVILIEKAKAKNKEKEELIYAAPTYLIYTLYTTVILLAGFSTLIIPGIFMSAFSGLVRLHSVIFITGLICLIIPGIILAILFGLVPLASVLIDNDSVNYFKLSYRMARSDMWLVFFYGLCSLLIELPTFAFDLFPDWHMKLIFNLLYSFVDSAILTALTITSVRIFYHLKQKLHDQSA